MSKILKEIKDYRKKKLKKIRRKSMKIEKILSQFRRDFIAILICEHCKNEEKLTTGYDDANYHNNVIPNMECKKCGKKADENYRPLAPKYDANVII